MPDASRAVLLRLTVLRLRFWTWLTWRTAGQEQRDAWDAADVAGDE